MADFDPSIDVRDMIAHGKHYNPRANVHAQTSYVEYPKFVTLKDGRQFIANSAAEEKKLLGIVDAPAKSASVDISTLTMPDTVPVAKQRGRPKKVVTPLPENLD